MLCVNLEENRAVQKDNSFLCYCLFLLLFMMTAIIGRRKFHRDNIPCKYKLNHFFLIQKSCKVKSWKLGIEKGGRIMSKYARYIASNQWWNIIKLCYSVGQLRESDPCEVNNLWMLSTSDSFMIDPSQI